MSTIHDQQAQPRTHRPPRTRRPLLSRATRVLNPLIKRLAGRRHVGGFALVTHYGRRSGRMYVTPVGARAIPGGFIIPMTFGEGADWFQNVQAARGCNIQWNGADYQVTAPEIIDWSTARPAFHRLERSLIPRLGITQFVRLWHVVDSGY